MNPTIITKYAGPVPRYTSYPTAPHFTPLSAETYAGWLGSIPAERALSLYLHIPFCDTLCWYCGCNTKMVQRYEPVATYFEVLQQEIRNVAERLPWRMTARHVHWGGGSPNVLRPADLRRLGEALHSAFAISEHAEFAVEIDARELSVEQVQALAGVGVNRVSLGVQDFDPAVQAAINRIQTFETTKRAVDLFRQHGVKSINIDLVYGLPHQTRESVERTIMQVLDLNPDRLALFGYAHLPSRFSHQRLIPDESLPGPVERFAQSNRLASILTQNGFVRVGLDHFARQTDHLATATLHRNFQGYTTDEADTLIGLGGSAIGKLDQGYAQNAVPTGDYMRRIREQGLATVRGRELTEDDRMRAFTIERLMCDLQFPARQLTQRFGAAAAELIEQADVLVESDTDGLVEAHPDGFRVTERGRAFIRTICSCFDAYFGQSPARHSMGV